MPTTTPAPRTRTWRGILLCLALTALLAACASPAGTPPVATAPPAASATDTPIPAGTPGAAVQPADPAEPVDQEALYNRWYTPVVASMYPFLICQSNVAVLEGTESGDARAQAAAMIAMRANAGREVLVNWDPPEEHRQIRTDTLAYLNILIETSRQWYQEEIDSADFQQKMEEVCTGAEGRLQDTAFLAREEGLTLETMQAISDRFQQALANP